MLLDNISTLSIPYIGIQNISADGANNVLGIETLETRNSDSLDFHDVSVWGVEAALKAAYELGRNSKK